MTTQETTHAKLLARGKHPANYYQLLLLLPGGSQLIQDDWVVISDQGAFLSLCPGITSLLGKSSQCVAISVLSLGTTL